MRKAKSATRQGKNVADYIVKQRKHGGDTITGVRGTQAHNYSKGELKHQMQRGRKKVPGSKAKPHPMLSRPERRSARSNEEVNLWDSWRPKLMEEPMVGQVIGVNQTGGTSDWDLNNHNVFNAVNAFVGSIADREYLIPENAVHQLKLFLERVGMTFPDGIQLPEGNGSVAIPLQRYGGTFGKSATTPYDEFDKEPENVGKTLTVTTEKLRNNSWKVYANIA